MEPDSINELLKTVNQARENWRRLADHWRSTQNLEKLEEAVQQVNRCEAEHSRLVELLVEAKKEH